MSDSEFDQSQDAAAPENLDQPRDQEHVAPQPSHPAPTVADDPVDSVAPVDSVDEGPRDAGDQHAVPPPEWTQTPLSGSMIAYALPR